MGNFVSLIEERRGYTFWIGKNWEDHYCVELYDADEKIIFHYVCDTFITGNYITHLKKAIKRYSKRKNKIIIARWHPTVDKNLLVSTSNYPYISTTVYSNEEGNGRVKFMVYTKNTKYPYIFTTSIKNIEDKLF